MKWAVLGGMWLLLLLAPYWMIPLGGYVKMLDEREGPVAAHELERAFNRQSVWRRFAILRGARA